MQSHGIMVCVEAASGRLPTSSQEVIAAAQQLAVKIGQPMTFVLLGPPSTVPTLSEFGPERIFVAEQTGSAERVAAIFESLLEDYHPSYLLFGGEKDLAVRIAAGKDLPCVTDATAVACGEDSVVLWSRFVYSGSLQEVVKTKTPAVITVRAGCFGKPQLIPRQNVKVETLHVPEVFLRTTVVDVVTTVSELVNLEEAEVVVAGGRGMGSKENFALVEQLAQELGGVVGASRAAIDAGWISPDHQVGQSGKTIAPKLYIACGISGAVQHVSGIGGAEYIVAINKDEQAPIFEVADLAVVGNAVELIPLMLEEIKSRRA